ncbi:MAG: hypothetical protein HY736_07505 [Verrucomicrobia bacterium]|nr:hypothetical protein [Verrucomicrobiota bacterium]
MKTLLLFGTMMLPAFGGETLRPLETPAAWKFDDRAAWVWSKDGSAAVLSVTRQSDFKPKVRRPFNLAWLATADWKSFTLTVDARLTKFDAGNNDLCLAFARQEDTRFYYAHLGEFKNLEIQGERK